MVRICTICARGGSKGVPGKNIRVIAGKPLLAHSVEQALATDMFAAVAVSSDSPEILAAAQSAGASILVQRPADLATDSAGKVPAILHCLQSAERLLGIQCDTLVDLDVTSPLRRPEDIAGAVEMLEGSSASSVITAAPARRSPYFNLVELTDNGCVRLSKELPQGVLRRQDSPPCFDMNASIYVWDRNIFCNDPRVFYPDTRLYVMPEERSHDIDSELDFELVRHLMEVMGGR